MKIEDLFKKLKELTQGKEDIFANSGIINRFGEMQYGFFPLGLGVLTENNKTKGAIPTTEIEKGNVMVLGNDFGTVSYVDSYVNSNDKKIGETDSKTINNLLNEKVGLNPNKTFFSNFYLGVRTHKDATMTKRIERLENEYKKLCYDFFIMQLNFIKPRMVICLGNDVKNALIDSERSFVKWMPKSGSIKKIYDDGNHIIECAELNNVRFVVIPHPCDLRNFNESYMIKLNKIINN